jgi:hypothetical protein
VLVRRLGVRALQARALFLAARRPMHVANLHSVVGFKSCKQGSWH